jgi:hypothetical protein
MKKEKRRDERRGRKRKGEKNQIIIKEERR